MMMGMNKIKSFKKLAKKKVKGLAGDDNSRPSASEVLLQAADAGGEPLAKAASPPKRPRAGFLAVYVGDERRRFVVPTGFLAHPLFRILLEKASEEFGFEQSNGIVFPCSVSTFQEVVSAVECCNGNFDIGRLVEEIV